MGEDRAIAAEEPSRARRVDDRADQRDRACAEERLSIGGLPLVLRSADHNLQPLSSMVGALFRAWQQ